ncbi:MAG: VWA domain-containing protein [Acidobacteriota bacterium]
MNIRSQISALLILFLVVGSLAQSGRKPTGAPANGDDTIKLRAEEVLLNISVFDSFGRQATDLKREDFVIAEDMQRQDIASFQIGRVPVNVVMLLDASGSVVGEIVSLRDSAIRFVSELDANDKVSIIEFHTTNELLQDWTSNGEDVRHAISWRYKPGMVRTTSGNTQYGSTALYDSIFLAADEQLAKVEGRKAIIILTDGDDTSSKITYNQALASIIKSGAVVYVISKAQQMIKAMNGALYRGAAVQRFERAERIMTELCRKTGGQLFSPLKDEEMKEIYAQIARELKNQYIITYVPKNEKRDGNLRSIKVFLSRGGYTARTRDSYYSPKN